MVGIWLCTALEIRRDSGGLHDVRAAADAPHLPLMLRLIRMLAKVPVVMMGLGAVASFGIALVLLVQAVEHAITVADGLAEALVELARVIDAVLIGVVMIVLAFGIYELLISPVERPLPAALVVHSVTDLELRVLHTVVVILAVTALQAIVAPAANIGQFEVVAACAVAIVAVAVFLRLSGEQRGQVTGASRRRASDRRVPLSGDAGTSNPGDRDDRGLSGS